MCSNVEFVLMTVVVVAVCAMTAYDKGFRDGSARGIRKAEEEIGEACQRIEDGVQELTETVDAVVEWLES